MSDGSLLPPNATAQERALALTTARGGAVPVPIRELWDPDTCPADKLAFLAWAFGVDEWDPAWSDEAKRATIRDAVLVQSRKGSVWSIRRVLQNAGYGDAEIIEGVYGRLYDAAISHNGLEPYGDTSQWATYRVILDRTITNQQADQVRRLLDFTAPARCELVALDYIAVANIYNAAITYDGTFNHGTA